MADYVAQGVRETGQVFEVQYIGPFATDTEAFAEARRQAQRGQGWSWSAIMLQSPRSIEEVEEK